MACGGLRNHLCDPPAEISMVELDVQPEPPLGLLLERLPEVDRRPQSAGHVAHVVMRIRELERRERARVGPAFEEASSVPGVDVRVDCPRMPREERDEACFEVAVEAVDGRVDLAAAKLARSPEGVVPEVAREVPRARTRRGGQAAAGG